MIRARPISRPLAVFAMLLGPAAADAHHRAARLDRARKLRDLRDDLAWHQTRAGGDADSDLVPDERDPCNDTADGRPAGDDPCDRVGGLGRRGGLVPGERLWSRLLRGGTVLYNASCTDAPRPKAPQPIAWGRRQFRHRNQAQGGGGGRHAAGLRSVLRRRAPVHRRPSQLSKSMNVGLVFHQGEDLLADVPAALAEFGLAPQLPPSAGRGKALDAFLTKYARVSWKLRAVSGDGVASPWSPIITQGPLSTGIP